MKVLPLPGKPNCQYFQLGNSRVIIRSGRNNLFTFYVTGSEAQQFMESIYGKATEFEKQGSPIWRVNLEINSMQKS